MSWHFSLALVEAFSRAKLSDGGLYAQLRSISSAGQSSSSDSVMALSIYSRSGTTYAPSTDSLGKDVLMWCLAASPVKPIPPRLEERIARTTYGRKCGESWQRQLPGTYLPKTRQSSRSITPQTTSNRWVTKPTVLPLARRTWARTICGKDIGYVHTPTTKANYLAPSMQKWESCRNFTVVFGKISPSIHEWLMGWPIGWTDLKPLEMGRYLSWRLWHGIF